LLKLYSHFFTHFFHGLTFLIASVTPEEVELQKFELECFEIEHKYWSKRYNWTTEEHRKYDRDHIVRSRKRANLEKAVNKINPRIKAVKNGLKIKYRNFEQIQKRAGGYTVTTFMYMSWFWFLYLSLTF